MNPLSGWKEIAAHLNQSVRTVQRWEALGLPVHRMGTSKRGAVIALAEELDAWETAAPRRLFDEIEDLKHQVTALEAEVRSLKGGKRLTSLKEMILQARAMRETAIEMRRILARHQEERTARETARTTRRP